MSAPNPALLPELADYAAERTGEFGQIDAERASVLGSMSAYIGHRIADHRPVRLTFICTHNSRRSHLCQLWAQTAAHYFSIPGVETFSGGTEATSFSPHAVAALQRAGFLIEPFTDGKNPIYEIRFEPQMEPMQAFSKIYDEPPNPKEDFVAIMTCSAADRACPTVFGTDERIAIPFEDPKVFDGTEQDVEKYDERCRQIAREMLYVFSRVAQTT